MWISTRLLFCCDDRQALAESEVWLRVENALEEALRALKQNVVVVGNNGIGDGASLEGDDEDSDDGLGYTIRVSKDQVRDGLDTEFTATNVEIRDRTEAVKQTDVATSALRLLRNACVACKPNQNACRSTKVVHLVRSHRVFVCLTVLSVV